MIVTFDIVTAAAQPNYTADLTPPPHQKASRKLIGGPTHAEALYFLALRRI